MINRATLGAAWPPGSPAHGPPPVTRPAVHLEVCAPARPSAWGGFAQTSTLPAPRRCWVFAWEALHWAALAVPEMLTLPLGLHLVSHFSALFFLSARTRV